MKRILTVDDSKTMRNIIKKALEPLEVEVLQAEDGQQGLQVVAEGEPDLILLDMTMPVMDGGTMLKELRGKGHKTPVVLLTAESGTTLIAPLVPLGFEDYIAKPFKAEELQAKVKKILYPRGAGASPEIRTPAAREVKEEKKEVQGEELSAFSGESRAYGDILVVDDMENVARQFKGLMPETIKTNSVLDAQSATAACRERLYRVVLIDLEIPNVNTASLVRQLRALQPTATFFGLVLRNVKEPMQMVKEQGLDGFLVKPFIPDKVNDFLTTIFESGVPVERIENALQLAPCSGGKAREERYFTQVFKMIDEEIEKIAAACFPAVIVDLSNVPRNPPSLVHLVKNILEYAQMFGTELRLVTPPDVRAILVGLVETMNVPMFPTTDDAKAGTNSIDKKG
jgi:two-component system, cell cycle response regulator